MTVNFEPLNFKGNGHLKVVKRCRVPMMNSAEDREREEGELLDDFASESL